MAGGIDRKLFELMNATLDIFGPSIIRLKSAEMILQTVSISAGLSIRFFIPIRPDMKLRITKFTFDKIRYKFLEQTVSSLHTSAKMVEEED